MKTLKELLYITEEADTGKWYVSFRSPKFHGGDSEEISEDQAHKLLKALSEEKKK